MIEKVGNRAFVRLNSLLSLPGTASPGDVDVGIVTPVIDLGAVMSVELVDVWNLRRAVTSAGATTNLRFRTPGDWTTMYKNRAVNTQGIPPGHDVLVTAAGIQSTASAAQLTDAIMMRWDATATEGIPLYYADARSSTLLGIFNGAGPTMIQSLPWFFPARDPFRLISRVDATSAVNWTHYFQVLAGPPGSIPTAV